MRRTIFVFFDAATADHFRNWHIASFGVMWNLIAIGAQRTSIKLMCARPSYHEKHPAAVTSAAAAPL
jgi:hypothetical protein